MIVPPPVVVIVLAAAGACLLLLAGPHALPSVYAPAALGALVAMIATARLIHALRLRDRLSISIGVGVLGFFAGAVSGVGPFPSSIAFAGAFLPAFALFLAGVGRERAAFELSQIEEALDDPEAREAAIARATAIRDDARRAARKIDPEARIAGDHAGDARSVFAYAAEVVAYGRALDGAFAAAVEALDEVPVVWMPAAMKPLMIGNLAFWKLCTRAPEAAIEALDRLPTKDAAAEHRAVLRVVRALALVNLGKVEEARALVGSSDDDVSPPDRLKARYAIVRAFCEVDPDRAREALSAVTASAEGRAELARMRPVAPQGDAAAQIIEEALASKPE